MTEPVGPPSRKIVAIGGGHGLAMTLRAVRHYALDITAVVSVADDGGSTGRLRRDLGVLGVGDLRKCLVALGDPDAPFTRAMEHRFATGDLEGHALGNLVLVGLAEVTDDWEAALAEAGRLVGSVGRVLPATAGPVIIEAEVDGGVVTGQVAIQNSHQRIRKVNLVPPDAPSPAAVAASIGAADQIVLAPGSLFTSLMPTLMVPAVRAALATARAPVVMVANLASQIPETEGLSAVDHLATVLDAGVRVDRFVVHSHSRLAVDPAAIAALGVDPVIADVARPDASAHVPAKLAPVLAALLHCGR